MKRLLSALAFLALALTATADAQLVPYPQSLPPNSVVGRTGISAGPAQAIPLATLGPNLFSAAFCTTANATIVYSAVTGWGCQLPLTVPSGGTACTAGSGTCLDNITGFASTGIIRRTGAGTYTFNDPLPTANGGTNLTTFGAANRVLNSTSSTALSASEQPTLGTNGGTGGQITLNGATSGSITVKTAAAAGTSTNFQLPVTNGSNGNVLQTDGTGVTSWIATSAAAATPSKQYLLSGSGATYTTPANARSLVIQMIGAGGGGGAAVTNAGSTGGTTTFNSINAVGGGGGSPADGVAGSGGTGGTGAANLRLPGSAGSSVASATGSAAAGMGAPGIFGTGGVRAAAAPLGIAAGISAANNTGAGGGGGQTATASQHGAGGGAGEYVELIITSPAGTYAYTVGVGGNGGAAGTQAGGNGGSGVIIVTEYYKWLTRQVWEAVPGMLPPPANDNLLNDVDLREAA